MTLDLAGLRAAPSQVWGNVRLVPMIRDAPIEDVRMALRSYGDTAPLTVARLDKKTSYFSYVPHGLVVQWDPQGAPLAAVDTKLGAKEAKQGSPVVHLQRMARGLSRHSLRLLPLHLAIEGYLALHFSGPDLADKFWSQQALRYGMSPASATSTPGQTIPGMQEALRVFERHQNQCGVFVFIGDHLASALVVGHPEDYAALHDALLTDFYGSLFAQHGWAFREVGADTVQLEGNTLSSIRASLNAARAEWGAWSFERAHGLLEAPLRMQTVRKAGRCKLVRFTPIHQSGRTAPGGDHIGEALLDEAGQVIYLKTYRLDRSQVRRGYLLSELHRVGWDPRVLAAEQGHDNLERVVRDLDAAQLGWMVHPHWRVT